MSQYCSNSFWDVLPIHWWLGTLRGTG